MQFDLVLSLEVAEHIPSVYAEVFIDSLTRLGPVILFSAAIPFQGDLYHFNEQWPNYWARYFQKIGYVVVNCIRKKIWINKNVAWWYAQNLLIFVKLDRLEEYPLFKKELDNTNACHLAIVHPSLYLSLASPRMKLLGWVLSILPFEMKNFLIQQIRKFIMKIA